MRIVLTSAYSWPEVWRGGERYLHEMAAALVAAGHSVRVLSSTPGRSGREQVLGVPVRRLHRRAFAPTRFGPVAGEVGFGLQALAAAGLSRVDVWHAITVPDGAAAAATGLVRPRLRTVYTELGFPVAASKNRRPDRRLYRFLADRVDAFVCYSQAAGAYLRSDYGREPTVVAPGVDIDWWLPAAARHPTPALLYTGSLTEPRKNLPLLLDACAVLRRDVPDLEVWLLGQGDAAPTVRAAPDAARDAVTVCGLATRDELRDRYARAWVTVLPSEAEAFGITVIESLACGTPVVALADGGGPAEVLRDSPTAGRLAARSAEGLAGACREALDLARQPATVHACRDVAERYDWRRSIVPRLERVYRGDD